VLGAAVTGRVLSVSITEAGRALAGRLPFDHVHGRLAETVRDRFSEVDGFVLFAAVGVAVRVVGPLLYDKATDPAVVCVDEAGRFAVAVAGGHTGGANRLAEEVATVLGATPVITTATDAAGLPALDALPGFTATGDTAGVTRALLDGDPVSLQRDLPGWPLPRSLDGFAAYMSSGVQSSVLRVTDRAVPLTPGLVLLHPPSLVVGVGASTGAPPDEVVALLEAALAEAGLARASVAEVATIDRRADDPAVTNLGPPVRAYPAERLAVQPVPHPSEVVASAVGTRSVAEAAALLAAGPGGELVVPKRVGPHATVALARRARPRGRLSLVGLGPGDPNQRTPAAAQAVREAEVVIGYRPYLELAADLITPGHEAVASPIGEEVARVERALAEAESGRRVALVCSGDAGIYALASLALEVAGEEGDADVEVIPGVTAATAAAGLLGAPLGHDHAAISLSDLLTPWADIERRLEAAGAADLVVALYNPRSRVRAGHLEKARRILLIHRSPDTPVGVVTDAYRPGQRVTITTLDELDPEIVGMTTTVIVGSSTTRVVGGRMVTPRGYRTTGPPAVEARPGPPAVEARQ
jgi:cobalt-precorrin 5A hydrolase / cobalt-factor III methyltransferase / precorrin-3B C17-methyltransferase